MEKITDLRLDNSNVYWEKYINFKNLTGKKIKYATFYLSKTNAAGDYIHEMTPFRVPCGLINDCTGYKKVNTGWYEDEGTINIHKKIDIEYDDGTSETLSGDKDIKWAEWSQEAKGCFTAIFFIIIGLLFVALLDTF